MTITKKVLSSALSAIALAAVTSGIAGVGTAHAALPSSVTSSYSTSTDTSNSDGARRVFWCY